ncbi:urease accessory protein UreF [Pendulispora brunnea]|uniref:Urease accessory protein UreF n=1 Tax=Pendulispora brunnea TaxID=2905690 RepID=A0ABZ2KHM7_9BACT
MTSPWLVWQLADSAFPAGGFAHSGGLEATWQLGAVRDFEAYLDPSLWQTGSLALPFVRAACAGRDLVELDALSDATLSNHVANRASRAQGRAFWATARDVFDENDAVRALAERLRGHSMRLSMHYAPVFGVTLGALGLDAREACSVYLHTALRGILSAAVRLGIVGPLEAQRLQAARADLLERVLASCADLQPEDAAQTFPLADACSALHDGLYARLFQS